MQLRAVAPFTGAWIEIWMIRNEKGNERVAPFTGAWIEILKKNYQAVIIESHPSRVRGLKFYEQIYLRRACSRTLHGCVD